LTYIFRFSLHDFHAYRRAAIKRCRLLRHDARHYSATISPAVAGHVSHIMFSPLILMPLLPLLPTPRHVDISIDDDAAYADASHC